MNAPSVKLLHRHFLRDALVVMEIADQQVHYLQDKKYGDVINTGDFWGKTYAHVPHAMLFDLWSALAESRLRRKKQSILRVIRADITFRTWERAFKAEKIRLTDGEKLVIFNLLNDFCDGLLQVFPKRHENGLFQLLFHEYQGRAMDDMYY
jgi:hypothetical protein